MESLLRRHTLFCNRAILVHFFSSNVSYFITVGPSKTSSPRLNSARSAVAEFGRLFANRYAIIDLCLRKLLAVIRKPVVRVHP